MKTFLFSLVTILTLTSKAQVTKVTLQASGLTCSMCTKAVHNALNEVSFVEKVQVDIKNQQYNITFKEGTAIEFDALQKAVDDAGFGVAGFTVTAKLDNVKLGKDEHVKIGDQYFHFLNGMNRQLNGLTTFTVVDKTFTTAKNFRKYSGLSKMQCVQTGRTATCCSSEHIPEQSRIYHTII